MSVPPARTMSRSLGPEAGPCILAHGTFYVAMLSSTHNRHGVMLTGDSMGLIAST
jgi:hypothetical protein